MRLFLRLGGSLYLTGTLNNNKTLAITFYRIYNIKYERA